MSNVYMGQILMFAGNFAPRNFAFCNGQLLSVSQFQALFALLGTTYGGNGTSTFALPNLQSRLAMHYGQGPGQPPYALGTSAGSPSVTITTSTMATHTHTLNASTAPANTISVGSGVLPAVPSGTNPPYTFYASEQPPLPKLDPEPLAPGVCSTFGGSQPHANVMPSLCVSFVICEFGIFPSQN